MKDFSVRVQFQQLYKSASSSTMEPGEVSDLHCQHLSHLEIPTMQQYNLISSPISSFAYPYHGVQEMGANQQPCFSSNSTSDEAEEQQLSLINERKQRRMISNRESARRSRMRKQKHLDELWSQVVWLRNENHQLVDKLNQVSESHDQALQENAQLKEETVELRQMLADVQASSPFSTFRELDEIPCNPSVTNSKSFVG